MYEMKTPQNVFARFYDRAVKTEAVDENGLPVYEKVLYCEIRIKDNRDIYDQPATEDKIRLYPNEYDFYLKNKENKKEGTPIELFAFLDRAQVDNLKERGIYTVEELAAMEEDKAKLLAVSDEYHIAKRFLEMANNNQAAAEFAKKEEEFNQEKSFWAEKEAEYKRQIAELEKKIKELKKEKE